MRYDTDRMRALDLTWETPVFYVDEARYREHRRAFIENPSKANYHGMLNAIAYQTSRPSGYATFTHQLMDELMSDTDRSKGVQVEKRKIPPKMLAFLIVMWLVIATIITIAVIKA